MECLGFWGGLLFVGLEMRQSQLIAIGAQQQARAELRAQILIAPFEGNIDAARVAFLDWEEMTDDQKLARGMLQQYRWNSLENNFFVCAAGPLRQICVKNCDIPSGDHNSQAQKPK